MKPWDFGCPPAIRGSLRWFRPFAVGLALNFGLIFCFFWAAWFFFLLIFVLFCSFDATFSHYPILAFLGGVLVPPPSRSERFGCVEQCWKTPKKGKKNQQKAPEMEHFYGGFPNKRHRGIFGFSPLRFPHGWGGAAWSGANKGHFLELCRFLAFFHPRFALRNDAASAPPHSNKFRAV